MRGCGAYTFDPPTGLIGERVARTPVREEAGVRATIVAGGRCPVPVCGEVTVAAL